MRFIACVTNFQTFFITLLIVDPGIKIPEKKNNFNKNIFSKNVYSRR